MKTLPLRPAYLRVSPSLVNQGVGVDRENKVLRGRVVAQLGPFKTEGRGEFDMKSLRQVVSLMTKREPKGTRSRWTHPSLSADGLGTYLGRDHNARLSKAWRMNDDGSRTEVAAVRSDLHLDPTAFNTPEKGDLATYLMNLVESDPDALSSSLVVKLENEEVQFDDRGNPLLDEEGEPLPPLWRIKSVLAVDVVDEGDACDGFLGTNQIDVDDLPDALVRRSAELLDRAFAGQPWEVVEARCLAWLQRYKELRFKPVPILPEGIKVEKVEMPKIDAPTLLRLERMALAVKEFAK